MSDTLTFYTHPMSRGRVSRWMLEETGLPYEEVIVDYGTRMKAPEYLAINPMGKVPALRHGDTVVTENAAICCYLAELVPGKRLAPPAGSPERAHYYRWLFFLAGPLEALFTAKMTGVLAPPTTAGYGNEVDALTTLEQAVSGKRYLAGDHFTAVDLYATALISYYLRTEVLERRPAFATFAAQHLDRSAALAANARDDALFPSMPSRPVDRAATAMAAARA